MADVIQLEALVGMGLQPCGQITLTGGWYCAIRRTLVLTVKTAAEMKKDPQSLFPTWCKSPPNIFTMIA